MTKVRVKYRECPECENYGNFRVCEDCSCGEHFQPSHQDLDFHQDDDNE